MRLEIGHCYRYNCRLEISAIERKVVNTYSTKFGGEGGIPSHSYWILEFQMLRASGGKEGDMRISAIRTTGL